MSVATPPDVLHPGFFGIRMRLYVALSGFFIASWLVGDLTGGHYFDLFGQALSVGMLPFPLTFVLTDVIHEFFGPRGARLVTWVAAGLAFYVYLMLQLMIALPGSQDIVVVSESVFEGAFGQSTRLLAASLTAFLIGQMLDVKVFHYIRERTGTKHVWLRANGSTAVSQLVDTFVINFAFLVGKEGVRVLDILGIVWRSYLWKIGAAFALTPLLYLLHAIVERMLEKEPYEPASATTEEIP